MNKNAYINRTVKKIKCGGSKKKEIRKQIESDIAIRMEQGISLENIIEEMGSPKEIADSFNDNISEKEKRNYKLAIIVKILVAIIIIIAIVAVIIQRIVPKTVAIENSKYFDQIAIEKLMIETVNLLDEDNFEALASMSTAQMSTIFTEETIDGAKSQIASNFGKQVSYGNAYIVEVIQNNNHFAVGEISVSYENVSVTYRLTYNENLELSGLYMR